ncbi:MAG: thiol:disulfide interchange protein DsbC [Enterobacterales bacterium]|jgi:thiol:disulfide interchange protein DsbC
MMVQLSLTSIYANDDNVQLTAEEKEFELVKAQLEKRVPSLKVEVIKKSPFPGLYEIFSQGQILYVSADTKFLISGKLFSIENGVRDLTDVAMRDIDSRIAPLRRDKLSSLDEADMVIFKAADEKYKITVFTDVDCGYCRKLHKEMPSYNKLGITVRYLGYPRAGLGSASHVKLQSIWCAKDRNAAMDKAKINRTFGADTCENPLAEHYQLIQEFRLNGTPAVILASGVYLPGYVKADRLLALIIEDEAKLAAN